MNINKCQQWHLDLSNMEIQRLSRGVPFTNDRSSPQILFLFGKDAKLLIRIEKDGCSMTLIVSTYNVPRTFKNHHHKIEALSLRMCLPL